MGGGIISERVATSNRNGWRDHLGIRNHACVKGVAAGQCRRGVLAQELGDRFEQLGGAWLFTHGDALPAEPAWP